jgi:NSS family neurotransmitter:Na+ symporter
MLILSYYSVIGGWTLAYIFKSAGGTFSGASGQFTAETFSSFVGSGSTLFIWHTVFMVLTMGVVAGGVQGGLEKAVQFLMPTLFFLLLLMVGYSMTTGYFGKGLEFLFTPDFSKLTGASMLSAMGQAFFSLSLGMGTIMIYGSYVPKDTSIASTSIIIALADTGVALLTGMAIFPIVFANNLEPGSGPGLIFQTLPVAFGNMSGGIAFGSLFFILLLVAAWTSSISLIEPLVTWLIETFGLSRIKAACYSGLSTWLLGLGTVWSFNWWAEYTFFGLTYFDLLDFLTSNLMLPLGGILIALFAGWLMKSESTKAELNIYSPTLYLAWQALVRYIAPVAVFMVLLNAIGLL